MRRSCCPAPSVDQSSAVSPTVGQCAPNEWLRLLPAERNDDFLVATGENDAAVFDRLDRELVSLVAQLQTKHLTFLHRFAVDDREARALIQGDGANHESRRQNVGTAVFGRGLRASDRLPADGPKWIATAPVHGKGRFVFELNGRWRIVSADAGKREGA